MMATEASTLANAVWKRIEFWDAAMWRMIANETDKMSAALEAVGEDDAEMMRQNVHFGAVSNIVQQMLSFGMERRTVREWVIE
jgi:hypothetical protein